MSKIFEKMRLAVEYHPEYRKQITHFWKIFDIHTIEECVPLESEIIQLAESGKRQEARNMLTEFVAKKCDRIISEADSMLIQIDQRKLV